MVVSRLVKVLEILLALTVVIGCSTTQDTGDDVEMPPVSNVDDKGMVGAELTIAFSPMYSAYIDAEHPCKIPAIVPNNAGLSWSTSDNSMVRLEKDDLTGGVMITTKKAGTVDIIARAGKVLSGKATLTISPFTAEEWDAGEKRYNEGSQYTPPSREEIMAKIQAAMAAADGGPFDFMAILKEIIPPDDAACTNCHGDMANMLSVQHTSQQIGGYSDDDLTKIITMGIKPLKADGTPMMVTMLPTQVYMTFHTWDAASADDVAKTNGILAYLRSLPPKTQGPIDFMGLGPRGAGGPPPAQ